MDIQKKKVLPHADRKFFDAESMHFSTDSQKLSDQIDAANVESPCLSSQILAYINSNLIGKEKVFSGPFGLRSAVYCDYTASGKSLTFIEDYIREQVLPEYGNTHTTTTVTSLQTTLFRHEARDIIRNSVNASEHDAVLFVGSGCTAAVNKLIHALDLDSNTKPVVFVGPYEHHSNLLPWREVAHVVIEIGLADNGGVDYEHLRQQLQLWSESGRELIGCFSVASNITGILVDVDKITILLHQHGAKAFWDYAAAGPYLKIDMNPVIASEDQPLVYKDAIFLSPHKFVGGVMTPGILVAKKKLFRHPVPSNPGGGSVFFVRGDAHRYLQEVEMREEGGTPAIVESIRAGLVFQLKEAVTTETIAERDHHLCKKAFEYWKNVNNLVLLGNTSLPRLPIFSIMIRHPETGLFLHHNFVCALLNDMFGIQARGGCACAGPYAQYLMGIDEELAEQIENLLVEDSRLDRTHLRRKNEYNHREILRPGFARLNLPYFMDETEINFILEAVKTVAEEGWKMLPQYIFNPETGEWRHRKHQVFKDRKWLGHITYKTGSMSFKEPTKQEKGPLPRSFQECLEFGRQVLESAEKVKIKVNDQRLLFDENGQKVRWFLLPSEAASWLYDYERASMTSPVLVTFYPGKHVRQKKAALICPLNDKSNSQTKRTTSSMNQQNGASEIDSQSKNMLSSKVKDNKLKNHKPSEEFSSGMTKALNSGFISDNTVTGSADSQNSVVVKKDVSDSTNTVEYTADIQCDLNENKPNFIKKKKRGKRKKSNKSGSSVENKPNDSNIVQNLVKKEEFTAESEAVLDISANTFRKDSTVSDTINKQELSKKVLSPAELKLNNSDDRKNSNEETCDSDKCPPGSVCLRKQDVKSADSDSTTPLKAQWHAPPKKIFKPTLEALEEYKMIKDGDKVLVCLSGGKDSLSLLHTIRQYKFYAKSQGINFEFGAVTVDPQTASYDPSPLKQYLAALDVPYFYEEQGILEQAAELPYECTSICSFCSRMKRGRIYAAARREGYNVLAMGQHLDDLAESFVMNAFHNGSLLTMKAHYSVKEGDLRLIRPFVYVRETELRKFAEGRKLPIIAENCPACFEAPKERHRTKQMLASQEVLFPELFSSLLTAIKPLMALQRGMTVNKAVDKLNESHNADDGDRGLSVEADTDSDSS